MPSVMCKLKAWESRSVVLGPTGRLENQECWDLRAARKDSIAQANRADTPFLYCSALLTDHRKPTHNDKGKAFSVS